MRRLHVPAEASLPGGRHYSSSPSVSEVWRAAAAAAIAVARHKEAGPPAAVQQLHAIRKTRANFQRELMRALESTAGGMKAVELQVEDDQFCPTLLSSPSFSATRSSPIALALP